MRVRFQAGSAAPAPVVARKPAVRTPPNVFRRAAIGAAVAVALAGCAAVAPPQVRAWKVEPVMEVRHGADSSRSYYLLGRYHDGSQAWDKAIDAYRKAIAADARNVEAYNALGVALARCHRFEEAEATLRKAIAIDPGRAHVWSNLGNVLLLAGRPHDAVGELKTALSLDRENVTARANLQEALAQSELRQARAAAEASAQAGGANAPAAIVQAAQPAPITAPAAGAQAAPMQVIDQPTIASLQPAITPSRPSQASGAAPSPAPAQAAGNVDALLEVSNGNGVSGMGARLRDWLARQGVRTRRLNNQRPFAQAHTEIQYRAGHADAAQRVAQALPAALQAAPTLTPGLRSDVRVVLGRDWVRSAACLERDICTATLTTVAAAPSSR
jgi:tetratricopeptide (TPR) repeat protein